MARVIERQDLARECSAIGERFRAAIDAGKHGREAFAGDLAFFEGVRERRAWRERLLSWPWRPWRAFRIKYVWTDAELDRMSPRTPQPINRIPAA